MAVYGLEKISFPQCYGVCEAVKILGVSECESVCPKKFERRGVDALHEKMKEDE